MNLFLFLLIRISNLAYLPKTDFGKFLSNYYYIVMIIAIGMLIIRYPLSLLLHMDEDKKFTPKYQSLNILYLFGWWKVKKKKNKKFALILNCMLVYFIAAFLVLIIGLTLSGEYKK